MKLQNYEIKINVTKDLYQRILQEASAKNSKMARVVRESVLQYFSLREELASSIEAPGDLGEDHNGKVIHTLLARTEARFELSISSLEEKLINMNDKLQFIISMVDRLCFDMMMYMPRLPENLVSEATARANFRYNEWMKAVKRFLT